MNIPIDTNVVLAVAAMIGAVLYTVFKYMEKKARDPAFTFDYTYAVSAIVAVVGAFMAFETVNVGVVSIFTVMGAFMTGFSFAAGAATINTEIPIQLKR